MKERETWDDRYYLIGHPDLHYGQVFTNVAFSAGVDSGACVILATANIQVTLPSALLNKGKAFYIKKANTVAGSVTVARQVVTDNIDGGGNILITNNFGAVLLVSDGIDTWWIIGSYLFP